MPIMIETREEFYVRHGGNAERDGNTFIFADGAQHVLDFDSRIEPPSDPVKLRELKYQFVLAKALRTSEEFQSLRDSVFRQTRLFYSGCGPSPEWLAPDWRNELKRRKVAMEVAETEAAALREELPNFQRAKEHNAQREHQRVAAQSIVSELNQFLGNNEPLIER